MTFAFLLKNLLGTLLLPPANGLLLLAMATVAAALRRRRSAKKSLFSRQPNSPPPPLPLWRRSRRSHRSPSRNPSHETHYKSTGRYSSGPAGSTRSPSPPPSN